MSCLIIGVFFNLRQIWILLECIAKINTFISARSFYGWVALGRWVGDIPFSYVLMCFYRKIESTRLSVPPLCETRLRACFVSGQVGNLDKACMTETVTSFQYIMNGIYTHHASSRSWKPTKSIFYSCLWTLTILK